MKTYLKSCIQAMWYIYPAINSIRNKWLRYTAKMLVSPVVLLKAIRLFFPGRLEIPSFELVITNKCTLNCRDCAHLIQHYDNPANLPVDSILQDIDNILKAAAAVYVFKLTGGEAFLHPELAAIIDRVRNSPKVKKLEIFTNGTIIPPEKVLTAMKHPKITVLISDYGNLNKNSGRLMEALEKEKISYSFALDLTWCDTGGVEFRGRNVKELKALFAACTASKCKSYLNGEFHVCPRSSNGMNLGLIPRNENEYIQVRGKSLKEARERIKKLHSVEYISACNYCDGITPSGRQIQAAIQEARKAEKRAGPDK